MPQDLHRTVITFRSQIQVRGAVSFAGELLSIVLINVIALLLVFHNTSQDLPGMSQDWQPLLDDHAQSSVSTDSAIVSRANKFFT